MEGSLPLTGSDLVSRPVRRVLAPVSVLLLLLWTGGALGAPMDTDRPLAGESSRTVGDFTFQVEVGPDIQQDHTPSTDSRSLRTPVELRYGITENTEITLESAGFASDAVKTDGATDETSGLADLALGFKSNFFPGQGVMGVPSTGLSVVFVLPVGSEPFRSSSIVPRASLLFDWLLPGRAVLNANIGVSFNTEADPRIPGGTSSVPVTWSAAIGRSLVGDLLGYAEVFGILPTESGAQAQTSADAGLLFHLTDDIQVDAAFRWGLHKEAPDWGATMGISFRHSWGSIY